MQLPAGFVSTLREVAECFDVSPKTVEDWRRNGMPGTRGRWPLIEIQAWRSDNLNGTDDPDSDGTTSPALEEYRRHRARLAEIEVQRQEGELVSREESERVYSIRVLGFKRGIRNLAKRINHKIDGLDELARLEVIQTYCDDVLREFAAEGFPGVSDEMVQQVAEATDLVLEEQEGEGE